MRQDVTLLRLGQIHLAPKHIEGRVIRRNPGTHAARWCTDSVGEVELAFDFLKSRFPTQRIK